MDITNDSKYKKQTITVYSTVKKRCDMNFQIDVTNKINTNGSPLNTVQ